MLPARAILSRRIVTRSFSTIPARRNSTRPTSNRENNAVAQETPDGIKHPPTLPGEPASTATFSSPAQETPVDSASSVISDKPDSWKQLSAYDLEVVKRRIQEWTDQAAITFRERADGFTSQTKTTFSQLGAHLNKVTGYEEIEALKKEVVEQEEKVNLAREAAKQAKIAYEQAVIQRSESQREVNELLQRKSLWTEIDLGRFTDIVRRDHLYEQEEVRAKAAMDETEAVLEREFSQLLKSILGRYHEEQVWSDKIRSASTYGSLAALGLNLLVFILAIVVVEPWKRRRLARTFETKIEELSVENGERLDASMREIGEKFVEQEDLLAKVLEEVSVLKGSLGSEAAAQGRGQNMPEEVHVEEIPVGRMVVVSLPGVPLLLPQRTFELAAVGVGAFILGVMGSILLN